MTGARPNLATEGERIVAVIIDMIIVFIFSLVIFIPLAFTVGFFSLFGPFAFFFGPAILLTFLFCCSTSHTSNRHRIKPLGSRS
jgi:uncharacterized RDD family membrane protein YckC